MIELNILKVIENKLIEANLATRRGLILQMFNDGQLDAETAMELYEMQGRQDIIEEAWNCTLKGGDENSPIGRLAGLRSRLSKNRISPEEE